MAKSKNHTNHNQSYKNHRNGIKNLPSNKYLSTSGVNAKLLRNLRRARKFDPSIKKQKGLTSKIDTLRKNKAKILAAIRVKIQGKPKAVAEKPAAKQDAPKAKGK